MPRKTPDAAPKKAASPADDVKQGRKTTSRGAGRPSSYSPSFVAQAEKLCALGATDAQMADFFEVHISTFHEWKNVHPEFADALKVAKDVADTRVKRSLYQRALGYEVDAVKVFMPAGAKEPVYAEYREHIPADTTACIFWLKNRDPENWRDKTVVEHEITNLSDEQLREEARKLEAKLMPAPSERLQ